MWIVGEKIATTTQRRVLLNRVGPLKDIGVSQLVAINGIMSGDNSDDVELASTLTFECTEDPQDYTHLNGSGL